jgi:crotonobetainyl-CoA:carnitine CoA-transferase CaiB-like acyl-CoA transferase
VIAIQNEREWQRFCDQLLGDAGLARDPRLESNQARVENRAYVDELVGGLFGGLDQQRAVDLLQQADIAYGRLNDMAGLAAHPQLRRCSVDTPSGEAHVVAVAAIRSGETERALSVPSLGQHSEKIREEFN